LQNVRIKLIFSNFEANFSKQHHRYRAFDDLHFCEWLAEILIQPTGQ